LPYILDIISIIADEAFAEILVSSFDGFSVAFERAFAPAYDTIGGLDTDEKPSWWDSKYLVRC
jgi:hypothetical protein